MRKATKLYVLLGVLVVVCAAAFAVSHYEQKKEDIKNSGEVVLTIPTDSVTALSWTNEDGTFAFTKGDDGWTYDDDSAFPVSGEKVEEMLAQFESFAAAFTIEGVDDYSQYGLSDPVCTVNITAGDDSYTVTLGDFSKMDEQRYVSIGDGNAYLVANDPYDEFDAVLRDMILDDSIPEFTTATEIAFSGGESYTLTRDEDKKSICADDLYFTGDKPVDTANVSTLMSTLKTVELTNYVTYNLTDEESAAYGMDSPDLVTTVSYDIEDDDGTVTESGTVAYTLSSNVEELAAYDKAMEDGDDTLPDVTRYMRVGDSPIVYKITETAYDKLTAVSYNELRHQKLFTADFAAVTSVDVTLDGSTYTFTRTPAEKDGEDDVWTYNDEEFDVADLKSALTALSADTFDLDGVTAGQTEIELTVNLDNEDFPSITLTLCRNDGSTCVAKVDGAAVALIPRSQAVSLIEAVNALTL